MQVIIFQIYIISILLIFSKLKSPLHYAYNLEVAKILVELGADINSICGKNKRTPLHNACAHDKILLNIADYLLNLGADPTIKDKFGKTPISILQDNCTNLKLAKKYFIHTRNVFRISNSLLTSINNRLKTRK